MVTRQDTLLSKKLLFNYMIDHNDAISKLSIIFIQHNYIIHIGMTTACMTNNQNQTFYNATTQQFK